MRLLNIFQLSCINKYNYFSVTVAGMELCERVYFVMDNVQLVVCVVIVNAPPGYESRTY